MRNQLCLCLLIFTGCGVGEVEGDDDAGRPRDAGRRFESATPDAATIQEEEDAGQSTGAVDAGTPEVIDAGRARDAGMVPADAGVRDAGVRDAGTSNPPGDAGTVVTGSRDGGSPFPLGWSRLPGTTLTSVCHESDRFFGFNQDCRAIINAWSGGVGDTKRNRLVVWGGGHSDYYGNEVYALDLGQRKLLRLNDPTPLSTYSECVSTLSDGKPTTRHTYGGLTYLPKLDKMALFGGVASCQAGGFMDDVFLLDFAALDATPQSAANWEHVIAHVPNLNYGGILGASDYDPVSDLTLVYTSRGQLLAFNAATNTAPVVGTLSNDDGYHYTGVVEPALRQFFIIGGGHAWSWALGSGTNAPAVDLKSQLKGCDPLISADYPGLVYDPDEKRIVAWAGGPTVYVVDLATKTCTPHTFTANAPGAQVNQGTHGRFRYFPAYKTFLLVNEPEEDAFVLNFSP